MDEVYKVDNTPPTVAISRSDPDPTNSLSVTFHVVLTEAVQNVDVTDFVPQLTGTATGSLGAVGDANDSDPATWTVTIDSITGDGTVGIDPAIRVGSDSMT